MRILIGKWYLALRFRNDLCVGVGKLPSEIAREALMDRPHTSNVESWRQ